MVEPSTDEQEAKQKSNTELAVFLARKAEGSSYYPDKVKLVEAAYRLRAAPPSERLTAEAERDRCKDAYFKLSDHVQQTLGKALGYPWYKDDQKNFPGATDADGVCVGEHVAESIADEAANRIRKVEAERDSLRAAWATAVDRARQHLQIIASWADNTILRIANANAHRDVPIGANIEVIKAHTQQCNKIISEALAATEGKP